MFSHYDIQAMDGCITSKKSIISLTVTLENFVFRNQSM